MNEARDVAPLAPGVFALRAMHVEGWCGLVVGRRRTLLIDAGKSAAEGRRLARIAGEMGHPIDVLAYTHGHWDHVRGGVAFPTAEVVAHAAALPMALRELAAAEDEGTRDAPDSEAGRPSITVQGGASFELGGRTVHMIETLGHSPGSTSFHIPDAGLLFAGDTVVTAIPPSFTDGHSAELEATVRVLGTMGLEVLVPGHGPILRGTDAIAEWTSWMADYLARVRDHAVSLLGTMPSDDIVAEASVEAFIGARLMPDRYDLTLRHERVVRTIIAELTTGAGS